MLPLTLNQILHINCIAVKLPVPQGELAEGQALCKTQKNPKMKQMQFLPPISQSNEGNEAVNCDVPG